MAMVPFTMTGLVVNTFNGFSGKTYQVTGTIGGLLSTIK